MKYIACKNIINKSDTLYVNESLLTGVSDLCILVNNWLVDRGCDDKELLDRVETALRNVYQGKYNLSESNHELFQVNISNNTLDKIYLIEFKYSIIGELAYKEQGGL